MNVEITYQLDALKAGSRSEYGKIYRELSGLLFSLAKQYLGDASEAEEIVQDAFLKLWEARAQLNDASNVRNFLYTVVKNNCLNSLRNKQNAARLLKNYHYTEMQYHYEALSKTGESFMQFQELKEKIDTAITALPDDLRIVFEMNRFQEMRYKDIALQLEISEKTVEARMSKALKLLRTNLKDYLPLLSLFTSIFS